MDKRFNELLENVKNQILDVFPEMDRDDREEFFNRLNEWSYEKYEEALLESELETPDYGEEYENWGQRIFLVGKLSFKRIA